LVFTATSEAEILQSQVLNAHTGQPIGGAAVLGLWWNQNGLVAEEEIETDAQGRFRLDRPAGRFPETQENLAVYKCGYVVWTNVEIFDPRERPSGKASPYYRPRTDRRIPSAVLLEPFPETGNPARHLWYINLIARLDERPSERMPKFWRAVQPEIEAARNQSRPKCQ
jgi:hypothetical protein